MRELTVNELDQVSGGVQAFSIFEQFGGDGMFEGGWSDFG